LIMLQAYGCGSLCKWALMLVLPAAAFLVKNADANASEPDQSYCA